MTILYINTGSSPNSGDGDTLRTAFNKINANFSSLAATTPISFPDQSGNNGKFLSTVNGQLTWTAINLNIQTTATAAISASPPPNPLNGELWYDSVSGRTYIWYDQNWVDASPRGATGTILPNENGNQGKFLTTDGSNLSWANISATSVISFASVTQDIIPAVNSTYNLGSPSHQWKSLYVSTNTIYINNVPITLNTATHTLQVGGVNTSTVVNVATEDFVRAHTTSTLVNGSSVVSLDTTGTITLPGGATLSTETGLVGPEGGYSEIADYTLNNYVWVDSGAAYIGTNYNNSANIWTFDEDGYLTLPLSSKINSGGIGTTNAVEFGTVVATNPFPPNQGVANITNSEIYMSGGSAESRIITDSTSGSLIYTGVEHVSLPAFAGLVAVDSNVSSQYSIGVDQYGNIQIGATQEGGVLTTNDYTAGVGTLNSGYTINGILANTSYTYIEGNTGISMKTDRGQVWFGNQPEVGGPTHWHIMKGDYNIGNMDLFLGDDTNYVKLPASEDRVVINSYGNQWQFDQYGSTTLPNGTTIYVDPANTNIVAPLQNLSIYTNEANGWTFQPDQGLRFPDDTVQYTAWDWRNLENIDMDGGSASTVYSVNVRFAEGGAAATRFGARDPAYNGASAYGSMGYDFTLDGGRA